MDGHSLWVETTNQIFTLDVIQDSTNNLLLKVFMDMYIAAIAKDMSYG